MTFEPKIQKEEERPEPRNVLSKLPEFLQNHDQIKKFFKGVTNHFFEPAELEEISGFLGRRSSVFDANAFYIPEKTKSRENYQLEPIMVSRNSENQITHYKFYEDLVDSLRVQGSLTNNHSRLFESEFWSWCPPINPDMLVNFSNYFWLEEGPPVYEVTESTNVVLDMIDKSSYQFPDGTQAQSGMRVVFRNDANTEFNNINFLTVNVGRSIRLLDDSEFDSAETTDQDYIVMERGAIDQNPWSMRNRWFHRNQISNVDLTNYIVVQARRPILQFEADIQLRNFGRKARQPVDLLFSGPLSDVQGKSVAVVDGVLVTDGMRILVTGETTAEQNNKVYRVTGHAETGFYLLISEIDGLNSDGSPAEDEVIRVLRGSYKNKRVWWDGDVWVTGQEKESINQYPKFELHDFEGVRLDDSGIYPGSTFDGSHLFGFKEDPSKPEDPVLGLRIEFNSFGEIVYQNLIQSEKFYYAPTSIQTEEIPGMKFYRLNGQTSEQDSYESDWRNPGWLSRQNVSDIWTIKKQETQAGDIEFNRNYRLSQVPETEQPGKYQTFRLFLNGQLLQQGVDYSRTNDEVQLSLSLSLEDNDFLEARSFDRDQQEKIDYGFYRIPSNLQANPNNESIEEISYNELFDHFITIIENQQGLIGRPYGVNNFNSTTRNLSMGTEILQHSAPMLKLMFLNQDKTFNIRNAIRFVGIEYVRWYSKFETLARQKIMNEGLNESIDSFIDQIISTINQGRDNSFPFKNSGMIQDNLFIPPTPSYLGFGTIYQPSEFFDTTITDRLVKWRRGHDGSLAQVQGGDFDNVMLRLEERIYESIPSMFKNSNLLFGNFDVQPGKYRASSYSCEEWNKIMKPVFETWAFKNSVDYRTNSWFSQSDPFTFNYGNSVDRYGDKVPGHWRGIYRFYFDTDRPHTHPWEMLGFGEKPLWWDTQYGTAPYTRENTTMWMDLQAGFVYDSGIDTRFARPGLMDVIPVDANGNLLDPIAAGIVPQTPPAVFASQNFKFGDVGPIEWIWRISSQYPFDLTACTYLARPAEWLEKTWNTEETSRYFTGQTQTQVVNSVVGRRIGSENEEIHTNTNRKIGSQQWVSDFWLSKSLDPEFYLGEGIRNLNVQLGYRTGSFINQDGLRITSDNFGLVPVENQTIVLNKSESRREPVYSGVIVQWDGTSYRVKGYDTLQPYLNYFKPGPGSKSNFTFGKLSVSLHSKFILDKNEYEYDAPIGSIQDVVDLIMGYGAWLESDGWIFDEHIPDSTEIRNWALMAKEFVKWADTGLDSGDILFLSPFSSKAAFRSDFGLVDKITQHTNGTWTAIDYEGVPMQTDTFSVARIDNQVDIRHSNPESLALLRLTVIEYDHAIIFDNETKFGNLIYSPAINLRQKRFRIIGNRIKFWNGRFDAPGYLIQDQTLIPNYDTNAENIRKFYDPYAIGASSVAFDHARHLVGYQKRLHMQEMLLDDRSQFNFFRGFLQEKGTKSAFDRLLRSTFVRNAQEDFQIFEEWAFKIGEYGAREIKTNLEFNILQSEIRSDPQTVSFTTDPDVIDDDRDQVITIPMGDERWVRTADSNFSNKFSMRNFKNVLGKDLPTAGPARLGETSYLVPNENSMITLFETQSPTEGNTVWLVKDDKGDWDIRRFSRVTLVTSIVAVEDQPTIVTTLDAHDLETGDLVVFSAQTQPELSGTHQITVLDTNTFTIQESIDEGLSWETVAESSVQSPVTGYGKTLDVDLTTITFTTLNLNVFSSNSSPDNLNLGGLNLTVDGDTVNFLGNIQTGLITNPKIRSSDTSTSFVVNNYPVTFEHTNIVGTEINPTVTVDATNGLTINGVDVVWTGAGTLDTVVNDINAAGINRIFADKTGTGSSQLRIWNLGDEDIILASIGTENALTALGLAASETGMTTADYVSVMNNSFDVGIIEASNNSGKIQIDVKNGGSLTIADQFGTPSVAFGLQSSYPARTLTQIVQEMDSAGINATEDDKKILFTYPAATLVVVSGTARTKLSLEEEYRSIVSYAEIVQQLEASSIPDVDFESSNGFLKFTKSNGDDLVFAGTAREELGFESLYDQGGTGPDIYSWLTVRRPDVAGVGSNPPTDGWVTGDLNFVDPDFEVNLDIPETDSTLKLWSVHEYDGNDWQLKRHQLDRIDTPAIESVFLFDQVSKKTINQVSLWDPVKKVIPGIATSEIFYIIEIDPAVYTNGDSTGVIQNQDTAWGIEQVGRLWWDLNAVRYLDYEQGDLSYRRKYWGRKLLGSSIDVYEWTRSPVPPSGWDEYVEDQSSNASSDYLPSGTVKNPENPAWVERVEFDKSTNHSRVFYYFWVLNPRHRPNKPFRKISAFEVMNIINSPQTSGVLYFSPIETNSENGFYESSFILGNATNLITNDDVIIQINFRRHSEDDLNIHKEWVLTRENSDDAINPTLWSKMRQSLIGENLLGLSIPDFSLDESRRYGLKIRPRQSMFVDRENARKTFINASNRILIQTNLVDNDPNWDEVFLDKDPEPIEFDFQVNTRADRDVLTTNPLFEVGMTVLVLEDEEDKMKWTFWSWDGLEFALIEKEEYDMQNFWEYEDWYDKEIDRTMPPMRVYETLVIRDQEQHSDGEIVRVLDNGEGRWVWTRFNDNGISTWWNTVAIETGTIQLNSNLYSFDLSDVDFELEAKIATGKLVDYFEEL